MSPYTNSHYVTPFGFSVVGLTRKTVRRSFTFPVTGGQVAVACTSLHQGDARAPAADRPSLVYSGSVAGRCRIGGRTSARSLLASQPLRSLANKSPAAGRTRGVMRYCARR